MSYQFITRIRRLASAPIFVLVAVLSLGVWMLLSDASASDAAISPSDVSAAASKLETLHQRTIARTAANDDDKSNRVPWGHAISPEQAAVLAQQVARARGDATTLHNYIELQTRNGRSVYAVRIGAASIYIDADTGAVAI